MHYHTSYLHLAQRLRPLLRPAMNTQVNNLALWVTAQPALVE
jgi:hypothetical protein